MSRAPIITELTALQADGLACVTCGTDYLMVAAPEADDTALNALSRVRGGERAKPA
jgi:hypothetical protein